MKISNILLTIAIYFVYCTSTPYQQLSYQLDKIIDQRNLKGIQISIQKNGNPIYSHTKGIKNQRNQTIDQNTMFRIASLSKSFCVVAIMQLVQKGKLKLNDSISSILGYEVKNPHYPQIDITIEMILSHQSSIMQTQVEDNYDQFLQYTYDYSFNGSRIAHLKQILVVGGKYYNASMFAGKKPGEYFHYSNLCFIIAATVVQIVSQTRFDKYMEQNILNFVSQGLVQYATYSVSSIKNISNVGALYEGEQGKWIPTMDNYNSIPAQPNLSQYKLGSNAGAFGPQGSIRASVKHLQNYTYIFTHKGVLKSGRPLLSEQSINQMLKLRFQYHGSQSSAHTYYNLYGLGLFTTSYDKNDIIIQHEVVLGHLGLAYGLTSGYHFWKDYNLCYIINGALNGYEYVNSSIYQVERSLIHKAVNQFIVAIQSNQSQKQNIISE